jgi:hypothetical protein
MTGAAMERIREELEEHGCQPRGSNIKLRARCPVHGSRGGTLAVSQGRIGALIHCFAQCETEDVLAALGLSAQDMHDEPRESKTDWRPRPRPATGPEQVARVIVRALGIVMLRDAIAATPKGPPLSADERLELAEWDSQQDADAHYWRTVARYAALACDEGYVRQAYADLAARRATHEQVAVLVTRAGDLKRQAVLHD